MSVAKSSLTPKVLWSTMELASVGAGRGGRREVAPMVLCDYDETVIVIRGNEF